MVKEVKKIVKKLIPLRAKQYWNTLKFGVQPLYYPGSKQLFILKSPVPPDADPRQWGDYHFAIGLAHALARHGHAVRIDFLAQWYDYYQHDRAIIVALRGNARYHPRPQDNNVIWVISHPADVMPSELADYNHRFAAGRLEGTLLLRQCTDQARFNTALEGIPTKKPLFVGNARGEFRKIVRDCVEAGLDFSLIGRGWRNTTAAKFVVKEHVPNEELGLWYAGAPVVLSDQWDDMARRGFIPNRIYDAVACGCYVVTTPINAELLYEFGEHVVTYRNIAELIRLCQNPLPRDRMAQVGTFDDRAKVLLQQISVVDFPYGSGECPTTRPE